MVLFVSFSQHVHLLGTLPEPLMLSTRALTTDPLGVIIIVQLLQVVLLLLLRVYYFMILLQLVDCPELLTADPADAYRAPQLGLLLVDVLFIALFHLK